MIIREATLGDIPTIVDFQCRMALETENLVLDGKVLHSGVTRLFKDSEKGKYYVASSGNDLAGCLMTTFEWSEWRNGTIIWIQSVYVALPFRRQGVYRKLHGHVMKVAQNDPSVRGVRLYVDRTNLKAREAYAKLGGNGDHYQVYEWMKP